MAGEVALRREETALSWQTAPAVLLLRREPAARRQVDDGQRSLSLLAEPRFVAAPGDEWHQPQWAMYAWRPAPLERRRHQNAAGVSTVAQRLMAIERAKVRRHLPTDFAPYLRAKRSGLRG